LISLLYIAKTPLQRLYITVRLWTEELKPPLLVPVQGARRSALRDTWGAARSGGRSHEGIDIFAPCGRRVLSATEGIVFSMGENNLGGQVVWVLGPGGSWHYYAHLSRFADLSRGNHVQAGDVIGYVGNTGNAAGGSCHLHYGIYRKGEAENPYPLLVPGRSKKGEG
jgi:murein DD-endopeptidase MepM/ murein hydrolase activator NlpD